MQGKSDFNASFGLEITLRPGSHYAASETHFNLERIVLLAQRLSAAGTKAPILARLDSGFDAVRLKREIVTCIRADRVHVDWLIKCNPRTTDVAALAMNILRLKGQRGLLGPDTAVRHSEERWRIKTVCRS